MEYCVIFRCRGSTFKQRFDTIKKVNCPNLFLEHMSCGSFEEFCKGIVDTTFNTSMSETHIDLLQNNVSQNTGIILFRHPSLHRLARICYSCKEILLDRTTEEMMVLVWYKDVRWCDEDWSQLNILSCKCRLETIDFREIVTDSGVFVAIPIAYVDMSTIRSEIKSRCTLGKNICYKLSNGGNKIQRSILIPKTLICIDKIEYEEKWAIIRDDIIIEVSPETREFLEFDTKFPDAVGHNLKKVMNHYHTPIDLAKMEKMINILSTMEVNETAENDLEFCLTKGRKTMRIKGYKISNTFRLYVYLEADKTDLKAESFL